MSDLIYPKLRRRQLGGNGAAPQIDFDGDTIKAMLVTATYVNTALATLKTHEFIADVTAIGGAEASGTGYTAGGVALANKQVIASGDSYYFDADDPSWAGATITARGVVLYKDTGTPSTSPLICLLDFGADKTASGGTFTVQFNASGIIVLA